MQMSNIRIHTSENFMKQTMLEHEAVFKNQQVHELHRLYRTQRNLVDEVNMSDRMSDNESKKQLPGFLFGKSICGEGSYGRLQNGVSSKYGEDRPVKVRRRMIDLRLPADENLDTDETGDTDENTNYPPFRSSKLRNEDASHQSNSSGSCLDVKSSHGLADLNEPLQWHESEPVALSRDMYSHCGRNNADVQGRWLEKNTSQNGWIALEAGYDRSTQRDHLHLPSHSAQVLYNSVFQPLSYATTDHSKVKFSGERAYREMEVRSKNPQVSYDSYVESSVASNVPSLRNDYRSDFVRPWSHWSSSWENPRSSSQQKSYPVQTNPFLNFVTHARADSGFEMRHRVSNRPYQGFSSGSKEAFFDNPSIGFKPIASMGEAVKHQSFESLQGPKMQECSVGLPWLKPKPSYKSEISNGCFDLNASANQFADDTDTGDDLSRVYPQNGLRSASWSNNPNVGRVEMTDPQISRKIICKEEQTSLISNSLCMGKAHHWVKQDFDMNMPCDASVSVDQQPVCVDKEEGNKVSKIRHYIDLNSCASEDEEEPGLHSSLRMQTKVTPWIDLEAPATLESDEEGESLQERLMQREDRNSMNELIKVAAQAIVAISLSDHQHHPDNANSSSTDAAAKNPLSWLADIITSCSDEIERKVDGSPEATDREGYREECSSGGIENFEAMTLNLQPTKEEDYMPKPLVPENLKFEGTGSNLPRRGQARRGRPKRDFQRDVLPGLASLSRQEAKEDIQLFSGLMETKDYTWNSGVAARRNSRKKRLFTNISQVPFCQSTNESLSVVGLEESQLTGWGKATRRPRRQRCPPPAGNPQTVILT